MNFSVSSVREEALLGAENGLILETAIRNSCVLVTLDKEFLTRRELTFPGILVIDVHPARDPFILPIMEDFLRSLSQKHINWKNRIIKLSTRGFEEV